MAKYRNIFFNFEKFLVGNGTQEITYYGQIYENALANSNFFSLYDKDKDLVITCNMCAKKDIKSIKKVSLLSDKYAETIKTEILEKEHKIPKTGAKMQSKKAKKETPIIISSKKKRCKNC